MNVRRFTVIASLLCGVACISKPRAAAPEVMDERLELRLFAEHPEIVTPVGMAIDAKDRVFVVESHTHHPPRDYAGPNSDWIKVFEDRDDDGRADRMTKFADGFDDAMNLAFLPGGELVVVCAREVWKLEDENGDGVSDQRTRLLELKTANGYAHSALLGVTVGPDGWIYVSRGNNGSARYRLVGTDGSEVTGFGDGGNIVRCRADGSGVEEFATGFWNPFDLKFDAYGRLIAVDNDPDARGPNRLLHIVEKGDYGYRSMYGGGGNHPYQGWDGDLPGTLGYVAGVGEAPSGVIDCWFTALPIDYQREYLVTVWNENNVVRFETRPEGGSLTATSSVMIQGDQNFRPVALAPDSKGRVFITDWVKVDYPNHGFGRIWRLSTKKGVQTISPKRPQDGLSQSKNVLAWNYWMNSNRDWNKESFREALTSSGAFIRHAGVLALSKGKHQEWRSEFVRAESAYMRLGALLAMRRAGVEDAAAVVRPLLSDPDEGVRRAALIWAGEEGLVELREEIDRAVEFDSVSPLLFETWLATIELLEPEFIARKNDGREQWANRIPRKLDQDVLVKFIEDEERSGMVRALVVTHLEKPNEARTLNLLEELAKDGEGELRVEALRTLGELGGHTGLFERIALDRSEREQIRAEALLALSRQRLDHPERLAELLDDDSRAVQIEVARTLRFYAEAPEVRKAFEELRGRLKDGREDRALIEQVEFALDPQRQGKELTKRPADLPEWNRALIRRGDAAAGERVFFSLQTQCSACHQINHRGTRVGPELSNVAQSRSREQIIEAILRPSAEFAPQWQAWFVELKNDEYYQGFQLDHKDRGAIELYTTEAKTRRFEGEEIARYGIQPNSLMPDGLEETMTVSELRDLVEFLSTLK